MGDYVNKCAMVCTMAYCVFFFSLSFPVDYHISVDLISCFRTFYLKVIYLVHVKKCLKKNVCQLQTNLAHFPLWIWNYEQKKRRKNTSPSGRVLEKGRKRAGVRNLPSVSGNNHGLWRRPVSFSRFWTMGECLFNSSVTDTPALGPDELLSLFALLILLSTGAIQIRAHGPLGSQEGGQPQLVAPRCASLCAL